MPPPTILCVDDTKLIRMLLELQLKSTPYNMLFAESGFVALEMLKKHQIDLVLLDIVMPDLTGLEVLEVMKREPSTEHIKVAMLTTKGDEQTIEQAQILGADAFLTKPPDVTIIKETVKTLLGE